MIEGLVWLDLLLRSRSLDMAATTDSGKKKRTGKVFGSLERGLDKMINMLTPNRKRGLREGPRKIKVDMSDAPPSLLLCPPRDVNGPPSPRPSPIGPVQRDADQSDRPRPGPRASPLHPVGEKYRLCTERVNELNGCPASSSE